MSKKTTPNKHPRNKKTLKSRINKKKIVLFSLFLVSCFLFLYFFWDLPNPTRLTSHPSPASTKLLDRRGQLLMDLSLNLKGVVAQQLIPTPDGLGILTDRDLRSRVLAQGRGPGTPIAEVMTPAATTIRSTTLSGDALLRMLEGGFHHFPVLAEDGSLLGVVTDTDLMGVGRDTPFAVKAAIERADDAAGVSTAGRAIPAVVASLMDASADPVDVGRVVALIVDAMTRRFLEQGIDDLGDPPTAWSWLALGSAARHEQAIATDQDHAMAYRLDGEPPEEVDAYFARLAEFVSAGLEEGGIPRCRAEAMATNAACRLT